MKAVLLVSHGSRYAKTKEEVTALVEKLRGGLSGVIIDFAFLELESPSIPEGIAECVKKGATEVTLLLNFLNSGKHVDEDIPRIVREAEEQHPGVHFQMTAPVGQHDQMVSLFLDLIK